MKTEFNVERVCERLAAVVVESELQPEFTLKNGVLTIEFNKYPVAEDQGPDRAPSVEVEYRADGFYVKREETPAKPAKKRK